MRPATFSRAAAARAVGLSPAAVHYRLSRGATLEDALDGRHRRGRPDACPWTARDDAFIAEHPEGAGRVEVAEHLGVTREAIRQIEVSALAKLREGAHGLDYDATWIGIGERVDVAGAEHEPAERVSGHGRAAYVVSDEALRPCEAAQRAELALMWLERVLRRISTARALQDPTREE